MPKKHSPPKRQTSKTPESPSEKTSDGSGTGAEATATHGETTPETPPSEPVIHLEARAGGPQCGVEDGPVDPILGVVTCEECIRIAWSPQEADGDPGSAEDASRDGTQEERSEGLDSSVEPMSIIGPKLRRAIIDLGRQSHSSTRARLDRFVPCVAAGKADRGGEALPPHPQPHGSRPDRARTQGFSNVLVFHVAQAVLAYYRLVLDEGASRRQEREGRERWRDRKLINHVLRIAEAPNSYQVVGYETTGFFLSEIEGGWRRR